MTSVKIKWNCETLNRKFWSDGGTQKFLKWLEFLEKSEWVTARYTTTT